MLKKCLSSYVPGNVEYVEYSRFTRLSFRTGIENLKTWSVAINISELLLISYILILDFSQLRICRDSLQKWPYLHGRCVRCWIKWKINFMIFIVWVMVDCIYNLQATFLTFQVCRRPNKKIPSKVVKFTWKMRMRWNQWKTNFPIFIFRLMVDFVPKIQRKLTNFEYKNDHI